MIGARYFSGSPFEEMAGYARAVIDGDMIYVSGTTGFDPETFDFPEDVESQWRTASRPSGGPWRPMAHRLTTYYGCEFSSPAAPSSSE